MIYDKIKKEIELIEQIGLKVAKIEMRGETILKMQNEQLEASGMSGNMAINGCRIMVSGKARTISEENIFERMTVKYIVEG